MSPWSLAIGMVPPAAHYDKEDAKVSWSLAMQLLKQAQSENEQCAYWFVSALSKLASSHSQRPVIEVLALTPHAPLFGNTSGKKAGTHWMVFMKPNAKSQATDAALSRQVACTDGLCGNGSEVGAGDTAVDIAKAPDIHAELTLAAFHREVAK